ncbi:MAG: DivIVA domain-containing protein [Clostridia bacterium]
MITPADIENKDFSRVKRGYDMEEVDDFLDLIIVDMEKLLRENRQLKEEVAKAQTHVDQHMSTETSVYETLEAAKSLMNDIAASAERRAEILLKNAELEASLITKDAKDSISRLTAEGNRLRSRVEMLRGRYKAMLETELDRLDFVGEDILEDFEQDFLPASMTDFREELSKNIPQTEDAQDKEQSTESAAAPEPEQKPDLSKTIVARP